MNNNCFVIQGGVTVTKGVGESDQDVIDGVHNVARDAMAADELLTEDNPDVKKVKFLDDGDNNNNNNNNNNNTGSGVCKFCAHDEAAVDTLEVNFKYSVETTSDVTDPRAVLPKVEESLVHKLADKLLQHCLNSDANRARYTRRQLAATGTGSSDLDIVGVCSAPVDVRIMKGE